MDDTVTVASMDTLTEGGRQSPSMNDPWMIR